MKLRCIIPIWKRPEVTLMCLKEMKRLQSQSKHEIAVTCIISEPEWIDVCNKLGFDYFPYKNDPLGEKLNAGIQSVMDEEFDYLMVMNSDSMVSVKLIDDVYDYTKPYFGINRIHFANYYTGEVKEFEYEFFTVLGVAKMIRKDVIEQAGVIYDSFRNKGLDDSTIDNLSRIGVYPHAVKYEGALAVDIKSDVNIWSWEHFEQKEEFKKAKSLRVEDLTFFENLCVQEVLVN